MNKILLSSKLNGKQSKLKKNIYIYIHICCCNLESDGWGYELFNELPKKKPEEDFWSCSRKRWMEDQD